jgi:ribosomal protein L11 methyltransferase
MKSGVLLQVSVTTTPEAGEAVGGLLGAIFGQSATSYHDAETGAVTVSVYLKEASAWSSARRAQLSRGLQTVRDCGLDTKPGRISFRKLRRADWAESWKRHFKPIAIGSALLLKPSWSRRRARPGQNVVVLDPGLSFGTGQHPTTRFCLEQLTAARKRDSNESFLDIGAGSGILAIAAAKLGYHPVEALDFDPDAVRTAQANAARNSVAGKVRIRRQDLCGLPLKPRRQFDVIAANLIADLLLAQKARILARLSPGGTVVLAGILRAQFPAVRRAYEAAGLRLAAHAAQREWESGAFVPV